MKISEVEVQTIKDYLNVFHEEDDSLIENIISASKAFVSSYTGLSAELMDLKEDLTMAIFVLSSELYDNRAFTVDKTNVNPVISAILDMHSVNLL